MSSSFSAQWGALLTLNVRTRCGFNPCRFQIRRPLAGLMPSAAAMLRVLQCVAWGGRSRVVLLGNSRDPSIGAIGRLIMRTLVGIEEPAS